MPPPHEIKDSPTDFYDTLLRLISTAKSRVLLSALYLGTKGRKESRLLQALEDALSLNQKLQISMIFDYSRCSRNDGDVIRSLQPLVSRYGCKRLSVHFYRMPQVENSRILNYLPSPADEITAVFHAKFMVFDDIVLLTGANLSEEYFTNRQDRYHLFHRQHSLARLTSELFQTLCKYSYSIRQQQQQQQRSSSFAFKDMLAPPLLAHSPYERQELLDVFRRHCSVHNVSTDSPDGSNANATVTDINDERDDIVKIRGYNPDVNFLEDEEEGQILLMPLLQHASLGIQLESQALVHLLHSRFLSTTSSCIHEVLVSTPYPSFLPPLIESFSNHLRVNNVVKLLAPSSRSHGFGNAHGWKSLIPLMHKSILHQIIRDVNTSVIVSGSGSNKGSSSSSSRGSGRGSGIVKGREMELLLYKQQDWTYHAKGIWIFPQVNDGSNSITNTIIRARESCATYIGSSNMGHRSWTRDLEFGFILCVHDSTINGTGEEGISDKAFTNNNSTISLKKEWEKLSAYGSSFCFDLQEEYHHGKGAKDSSNNSNVKTIHSSSRRAMISHWKFQLSRILGKTLRSFL